MRPTKKRATNTAEPCWDKAAKQWTMLVGYHLTEAEDAIRRVRTRHYFGSHLPSAKAMAAEVQARWHHLKDNWAKYRERLDDITIRIDWSRPVWITNCSTEKIIQKSVKETQDVCKEVDEFLLELDRTRLREIAERRPGLIEKRTGGRGDAEAPPAPFVPCPTISEAKDRFVQAKRAQVGLLNGRGITAQTYNGIKSTLNLSLGLTTAKHDPRPLDRKPIDLSLRLDEVTHDHIEGFVNFWMSSKVAVLQRTAINYARQFRQLLRFAATKKLGLSHETLMETEDLFCFRMPKSKIEEYRSEKLKAVLDACFTYSEKTALYTLLALNCGFYQKDISDLRQEDLCAHNGDHCLWRARSKSLHQHDDGEMETLHFVWPETHALLLKYGATAHNPHGRLLLNEHGLPLWREEPDELKKDAISPAYNRATESVTSRPSFRQFRKIGWNACKRLAGGTATTSRILTTADDMARLYAGQAIQGVAKHYNKDDFEPLTAILKRWREELVQSGVLPRCI